MIRDYWGIQITPELVEAEQTVWGLFFLLAGQNKTEEKQRRREKQNLYNHAQTAVAWKGLVRNRTSGGNR